VAGCDRCDKMARVACLMMALVAGAQASVELTTANFDAEIFDSGKNAFIKFQAPW